VLDEMRCLLTDGGLHITRVSVEALQEAACAHRASSSIAEVSLIVKVIVANHCCGCS
jgi:hypothetical protein